MAAATYPPVSVGVLAMLIGLFAIPAYLLWAGHHWRKRSARVRGAFWGGVIAHSIAALFATAAAMWRPVLWSEADVIRGALGYWLMLLASVAGIAIGWWVGGRQDGQ